MVQKGQRQRRQVNEWAEGLPVQWYREKTHRLNVSRSPSKAKILRRNQAGRLVSTTLVSIHSRQHTNPYANPGVVEYSPESASFEYGRARNRRNTANLDLSVLSQRGIGGVCTGKNLSPRRSANAPRREPSTISGVPSNPLQRHAA